MYPDNFEAVLAAFVDDDRLSDDEKAQLRDWFVDLEDDHKGFVSNRVFDLAREHITTGSDVGKVLAWLQKIMGLLGNASPRSVIKSSAHFSPGDACRDKLIQLIGNARQSIDVCVFTISDNRISEALVDANDRNVKVRVVTDNDKVNDLGSDIEWLREQGVEIRIDDSPYHMHHKFMVVDMSILVNGSFNWTKSASINNEENILVIAEPALVEAFLSQFEEIWDKYA